MMVTFSDRLQTVISIRILLLIDVSIFVMAAVGDDEEKPLIYLPFLCRVLSGGP